MEDKKTVKYHVPKMGIYLYARMRDGKNEMIILNSTNEEQKLCNSHYNQITQDCNAGVKISTGETIDFTKHISLMARESVVIEF